MTPLSFASRHTMLPLGVICVAIGALSVAETMPRLQYQRAVQAIQLPLVHASAVPQAEGVSAKKSYLMTPVLELHIANNGLTLLRGAVVRSVSGDVIYADMIWGGIYFTWTIHVDASTRFIAATGGTGEYRDIRPGDAITVTGMLTGTATGPAMNAQFVRR